MNTKSISYIIEGVDMLGKSSLIENLQHTLGFFNTIHYEKPKLLKIYGYSHTSTGDVDRKALETYQKKSFESMFNLLSSGEPFIMDRGHLGENIYAPRYRGYDGSYVFDLEEKALKQWYCRDDLSADNCDEEYPAKLILLTTSDFSFIQDDGLSFDFSQRFEEQEDFIKAFDKSILPKIKIDVCNGKGKFKNHTDILEEVLNGK